MLFSLILLALFVVGAAAGEPGPWSVRGDPGTDGVARMFRLVPRAAGRTQPAGRNDDGQNKRRTQSGRAASSCVWIG